MAKSKTDKKAEKKTEKQNIEAYAMRTDCVDGEVVEIAFLDKNQDPFAHILLSASMTDALLARLTYVRDQAIGLIPNTTLH